MVSHSLHVAKCILLTVSFHFKESSYDISLKRKQNRTIFQEKNPTMLTINSVLKYAEHRPKSQFKIFNIRSKTTAKGYK